MGLCDTTIPEYVLPFLREAEVVNTLGLLARCPNQSMERTYELLPSRLDLSLPKERH